jgi:hypothetical protein
MSSLVIFAKRQYTKQGLRSGKPGFWGEAFRTSRGSHTGGIREVIVGHVNMTTVVVFTSQMALLVCVCFFSWEKYRRWRASR